MTSPYFLTTDPPNAGVLLAAQDGRSLTQAEMYMRNNFPIPKVAPAAIEIVIPGRATRSITVVDLAGLEWHRLTMILECAGNGRILMSPIPDGTPWDLGGASTITATGVRISDVVGHFPDDTVDVVFTGADSGEVEPEGDVPYQFSLSREVAMSGLPLLVTHIGDAPLTLDHGAPMRLIVPGHYAMKSVKWLRRIEAVTEAFTGHFVTKYRYYQDSIEAEGSPVGPIGVRSIISNPTDGADLGPGPVDVNGLAWSGTAPITGVEVSIDEGHTWSEAEIEAPEGSHHPTRWRYVLDVLDGSTVIMARASDSSGATQPLQPRWNRNGYANNVAHRVTVRRS